VRAHEELDAIRVKSIPWMEDEDRVLEFADIYRRTGMDDRKAADTADGLERITLDDFRADIGAGLERKRKKRG
jgi:hypothetical protein